MTDLSREWEQDESYLLAKTILEPEFSLDDDVARWVLDHGYRVRWLWAYRLGQWLIRMAAR